MATAQPTTNHDEIRSWVEDRGGRPARVKATGEGNDPGILRIDFPGFSGEDTLEEIEWDEFFDWFDRDGLALLLSDEEGNRFNKMVSRETASAASSSTKKRAASRKSGGAKSSKKAASTSKKAATSKRSATTATKASAKKATTKKATTKKQSAKKSSAKKTSSKSSARAASSKRPASTRKASTKSTKGRTTAKKAATSSKKVSSKKSPAKKSTTKKSSTKKSTKSRAVAAVRSAIGGSRKGSGRSSSRQGAKASSRRGSGSSVTTTDRNEIRRWVEARGGFPAHVRETGSRRNDLGVLRIDYPGYSGKDTLERVSWDAWFKAFDRNKLAFLYQDKRNSRFSKLVAR